MKEYKLTINNNSYTVVLKDVSDKAVVAEVNGKLHTVQIDGMANLATQKKALPDHAVSVPAAPPAALQKASPNTASGAGAINTPIPGQIISISVSVGEQVCSGQKLLVLEAMKLENSITASMDGTVSEVLVAEGDVVNQGQPLIVLT